LTEGVSSENTRRIYALLESLNDDQRQAFNLVEREGQLYLNHW
jgi:DNA-directed RNA polymerase specialized sigma24 family protein